MRFWLLIVTAFVSLLYGLGDVASAVEKWNSTWTCVASPAGHRVCSGTRVLFLRPDWNWSPSPWVFLAIGLGLVALGSCLFVLALRTNRRLPAPRALG